MAWFQTLNKQFYHKAVDATSRFNVTLGEDLEENGPNCSSLDYFKRNTKVSRVTVKKFDHSSQKSTVYVYVKHFKWVQSAREYLRHRQIPLTLHEFKCLIESFADIDAMIDGLIEEHN